MPKNASYGTLAYDKPNKQTENCLCEIYAYRIKLRRNASMKCYIELECEHGEGRKHVIYRKIQQKLKTRVQNTRHHANKLKE